MSVHVLSWVLRCSEETLGRRLVLLVLADHAKDDGTAAWPSVATIGREARMSRRSVQEALRRLQMSGAIAPTGVSRAGTTIYSVVMEGGAESARGAEEDEEGARLASPDPSLEPSEPPADSQTLVAEYVDRSRAIGVDPPKRLIGHIAREVKALLDEGQPATAVRGALALLVERRLNPAALASLIPEAVAGPGRRSRPAPDTARANLSAEPVGALPDVSPEEREETLRRLRGLGEGIGRSIDAAA